MGKLGVGEGYPRYDLFVHPRRQPEQRVPDDEAGMVVGEMGELPAAHDVADGVDPRVRGLEPLVDEDPIAISGDAGALEGEIVGIGASAGRDQEMARRERLLAVAVAYHDLDRGIRRGDADDGGVAAYLDAFA